MSEAQQNGVYTYEVARKLTTGSKFDVHFSDMNKTYYFGVAAFDNAQVGMRCRMRYRSSYLPSNRFEVKGAALRPFSICGTAFENFVRSWLLPSCGHASSIRPMAAFWHQNHGRYRQNAKTAMGGDSSRVLRTARVLVDPVADRQVKSRGALQRSYPGVAGRHHRGCLRRNPPRSRTRPS
jgi:hypothetical protein